MGYRPQRKVYRLRFADPDMAGLIVQARSAPIGQFLGLAGLADLQRDQVSAGDMARVDELLTGFADCLVEWNLEDEQGAAVPATLEGVRAQETDFILRVVFAWIEAVASVPGPLGAGSSDGGRSVEQSIPMEPLSPNHRSLQTQSSS